MWVGTFPTADGIESESRRLDDEIEDDQILIHLQKTCSVPIGASRLISRSSCITGKIGAAMTVRKQDADI